MRQNVVKVALEARGSTDLNDLKLFFVVIFSLSSLQSMAQSRSLSTKPPSTKPFSTARFLSAKSLSKKKTKSFKILEVSRVTNVYQRPNFDAKVIIRLESGRKIVGAIKTTQGTDGFGLFHRVKLKKGFYGYIVDTDIKGFKPSGIFSRQEKKRGGFFSRRRNQNRHHFSPMKSISFGLTYAYMDYNIATLDQTLSSKSSLFGFKFTGPWLFHNLPLDLTLLLNSGAPSLFDAVATEVEGYFGFLDLSYQSVFGEGLNSKMYWSLGPALSYYDFDIQFNGLSESKFSSRLDIGVSVGLGWAHTINSFLVRFEGRYLRTNESHLTGLISIQRYF